ncbi:MAG: glycosyltransferase [Anaerolineales bacterium]|nr:glycosyltransferase [Anaerolineales bacterium]
MRLLILNHVTHRSGGEVLLLRWCQLLDKTRYEIFVALPSAEGMLPEALGRIPGVQVQVLPVDPELVALKRANAVGMLAQRPALALHFCAAVLSHARLIRRAKPDLVLTNSLKSHFYGSLAAWLARRPVVWCVHDVVDSDYFPAWSRRSLGLLARLLARRLVCVSQAVRASFERVGLPAERLTVVYPPPMAAADVPLGAAASLSAELALPARARLVTLVGRIAPPKGQLLFVQAAVRVLAARKDTVFLIVGESLYGDYDHDYKRQVQEAIAALPEAGQIQLLGARPDVRRILDASDVVVFPSLLPEGLGLAVVEALELGRPVVATTLGGTVELANDGQAIWRVAPGDVAGLAGAILTLLESPARARALGAAGQQHVRRLVCMDNLAAFEAVLEHACR